MIVNFLRPIFKRLTSILRLLAITFGMLIAALLLFGTILYFNLPDVSSLATTNPSTTAFIELRRAEAASKGRDFKPILEWVPLSKISPYLINSIIYNEDFRYWKHGGIDWKQIWMALNIVWHQHRVVIGGSSITMQLGKNLYLSPDRTLLRKFRQMLIAIELERHLSKERILEIYLNVIEWGDGVFGIEGASKYWFNRSANELNPTEAIKLALIVPSPRQRNPKALHQGFNPKINEYLMCFARDGIMSHEMAIEQIKLRIPIGILKSDAVFKYY
jgi:monofunctional glycosyltransferase